MAKAASTLLVVGLLMPMLAGAADQIPTKRVQFERGATSAVVEGTIRGRETIDYLVRAGKGQVMNASLATKHGATYFNILAPGENEVAMFVGSVGENQYEGTLPAAGDYKLRVYMMRSAARRNEVAKYRLEIIVSGAAERTGAPASDAKVAGTKYHATGEVPCSMGGGQPTRSCPFGVVREGPGKGAVTITKPDGGSRTIFFEGGRATGYDRSQADADELSASRDGDLTIVRIGSERYEIPDAVIDGG